MGAGHLKIGDRIKQADGTIGLVANVTTVQQTREMFNLTVSEAHTYYVGQDGWLVHNCDTGRLVYRYSNPNVDMTELERQIAGQVDAMNRIIANEGMTGLKARILAYDKEQRKAGDKYISDNLGSPSPGMAWLHEPDMRVGGNPSDVTRAGDRNINSILGGQAPGLARAILSMPDTTTKILWNTSKIK